MKSWQSKSIHGGSCASYRIDAFGQLWYNDYTHPAKSRSNYSGLFEIHTWDAEAKKMIEFTFTFKDGIVQSVQPGRLY